MTVVLQGPGHPRAAAAPPVQAPHGLERTELVSPTTVRDACRVLADAHAAKKRAVVLAGGTDFIVDRQLADVAKSVPVDVVVDVTRIPALSEIHFFERGGQGFLRLGGGVTYWALRRDARVAAHAPMLARMAADVGAVQIQTRGTLAGNLATASPAADGVAALMALEAVVTMAGEGGEREVPIAQFFTGYRKSVLLPAEIITSVVVRAPAEGAFARWQKVGTRLAQAISKVALASVVEIEAGVIRRARFGMASVAPTTAPLDGVRAYLEGRAPSDVERSALDLAVEGDIHPIDDVRSTGEYRLHVAKVLVRRAAQRGT